ncbi:hypothetical protein GCM10010319_10050 [Streptomyces blastmyceticus]|uniref:Secreted protein n=1 Tax=Streptomyces blastmyceticus TaxID=68180 RepID=A0ABN0WFP5_9ACTN
MGKTALLPAAPSAVTAAAGGLSGCPVSSVKSFATDAPPRLIETAVLIEAAVSYALQVRRSAIPARSLHAVGGRTETVRSGWISQESQYGS